MITSSAANIAKLDRKTIESRLAGCPALPSLGSINKELQDLLQAEQRYSTQISEIIRRDPSLTARLLKVVNSVYYGLSTPVTNIEEAVFYLGLQQLRQLATVTPVIEDFQRLTHQCPFPWHDFWQHCIGTAILTREILGTVQTPVDEYDYVAGLVHDVGKIVMAWAFPDHFTQIHHQALSGKRDVSDLERDILGMDHSEVGAIYLEGQGLPPVMVDAARYHHFPERAERHRLVIAAVQIGDLLMRAQKIGCSGNYVPVTREMCVGASGWSLLLPKKGEADHEMAQASLHRCLERLPSLLEGLI